MRARTHWPGKWLPSPILPALRAGPANHAAPQAAMAADASTAAMCTYLIEARKYGAPTPDLSVSRDGKPKPA